MSAIFSTRTSWDLAESPLAAAIRSAGRPLIDLTVSNPTACGFCFDDASTLAPLQDMAALTYQPDPRGIPSARAAVAAYYAGHRAIIDPDHILLTTSTSEAYSFLFRLLCDPGDEVLVAQPSYPLFDFLATLDHVVLRPYPLFYDFGWWIDVGELERRITPRTRALLLVHPNNPTGHASSAAERAQLEALCARHRLALIVDEVFLDYTLAAPIPTFAAGPHSCLSFIVSGLSKIAALPQMKVGWLAVCGPEPDRGEALGRLEIIADTFLSVNAPAQHALPSWLAGREAIASQVLARVRENLATLGAARHLSFLPVDAGWSAIVQVAQSLGSESLAERLVAEAGVIVHPASFYSMVGDHRFIISLIGPARAFVDGLERISIWCDRHMHPANSGSGS